MTHKKRLPEKKPNRWSWLKGTAFVLWMPALIFWQSYPYHKPPTFQNYAATALALLFLFGFPGFLVWNLRYKLAKWDAEMIRDHPFTEPPKSTALPGCAPKWWVRTMVAAIAFLIVIPLHATVTYNLCPPERKPSSLDYWIFPAKPPPLAYSSPRANYEANLGKAEWSLLRHVEIEQVADFKWNLHYYESPEGMVAQGLAGSLIFVIWFGLPIEAIVRSWYRNKHAIEVKA